MNWRQFYLANKPMVLTLPGLALWSLPLGVFGLDWLRNSFPQIAAAIIPFIPNPVYVACALMPVAAVCSFKAIMEFSFSHGKKDPVAFILLILFNVLTVFLTSLGSAGMGFFLLGSFLNWTSR